MTVILRKASATDVALLEYWDTKPHVIACTGSDDWGDWTEELALQCEWMEILIAELEGRPIGVLQIIDPAEEESHYWGDVAPNQRAIDIWIGEETDLGQGLGTQMMQLALKRCFTPPEVTAVLIDPLASNTPAHRFYERLGFKQVGSRRFGEDDCIVYKLSREVFLAADKRL